MEEGILDDAVHSDNLELGPESRMHLNSMAKWSKFFAIVGFVFGGLVLVMAIFAGSIMATLGSKMASELDGFSSSGVGIGASISYALFSLLYFVPSYYAYKYSNQMKEALRTQDSYTLTTALSSQKSVYKFWGIVTIIGLVFYGFAFLIVLIIGAAGITSAL